MSAISNRIRVNENMEPKELEMFMLKHGISEKELSEIFGVTSPAIRLWLTGARAISTTNTRLIRMFAKYPTLLKEF